MELPTPNHRAVQQAAKDVLAEIVKRITPDSTERTISTASRQMLVERGLPDTWYYECPALVLLGRRSCDSASGRDYVPSDEPVGQYNLVTIDLSPRRDSLWGDCTRSIYVEEGVARPIPKGEEFLTGHCFITQLHDDVRKFVTPDTTFAELHEFANSRITTTGFENLDYLGNVGHSIATRLDDRLFIEPGNHHRLGDVGCFTFEPHVRAQGGRWGFKHENIYYFSERGMLEEL